MTPLYKKLPVLLLLVSLLFTPFYPVLSPYLYPGPHIAQYYVLPSNSTLLGELISMIPNNASLLASDYIFAHVVSGINSYPLLYVNNFTAGRIEPIIHLPNNFTPDYIAIVPTDYNATVNVIKGFPNSYGLLGAVVAQYPALVGFGSFDNQKVEILLYQYGYRGTPKFFLPNPNSYY